ncbi:MAG: hypothetical protein HC923_02550 [Myxococcales bacterium]|nr:hypothetical protein [Myxococcales bacterium]
MVAVPQLSVGTPSILPWRVHNAGFEPISVVVQLSSAGAVVTGLPSMIELERLGEIEGQIELVPTRPGWFDVQATLQPGGATVQWRGEAVEPRVEIAPERIDFGDVVLGHRVVSHVEIANRSGGAARIDGIGLADGARAFDVDIEAPTPWRLHDEVLTVSVGFRPDARGPFRTELRVESGGDVSTAVLEGRGGTCEELCPIPHGSPWCFAGDCRVEACEVGFHDLDGAAGNGCECADASDIGATCATPSISAGSKRTAASA